MILSMQPITPSDDAERQLLMRYLDRKQTDLANIEKAIAGKDYEEARRIGHNLAGSGAAYGFIRVSVLGRQIEAAAQQRSATGLADAVAQLRVFLSSVVICEPN